MSPTPSPASDSLPADFHAMCDALPLLFRKGGTAEEVEQATAGVMRSLESFAAPRGSFVEVELIRPGKGWSATFHEDACTEWGAEQPDDDPEAVPIRLFRPVFDHEGDIGFLLVPGGRSGWTFWDPVNGPAPEPARGRANFVLVVVPKRGGKTTAVQFQEKWGEDLKFPLYSVTMSTDAIAPQQQRRLVEVLRALAVATKKEGEE